MKISARNNFNGTIKHIAEGAINNEVIIELAPNVEIIAVITKSSCERLGLVVGGKASAIVKASSVMIGVE